MKYFKKFTLQKHHRSQRGQKKVPSPKGEGTFRSERSASLGGDEVAAGDRDGDAGGTVGRLGDVVQLEIRESRLGLTGHIAADGRAVLDLDVQRTLIVGRVEAVDRGDGAALVGLIVGAVHREGEVVQVAARHGLAGVVLERDIEKERLVAAVHGLAGVLGRGDGQRHTAEAGGFVQRRLHLVNRCRGGDRLGRGGAGRAPMAGGACQEGERKDAAERGLMEVSIFHSCRVRRTRTLLSESSGRPEGLPLYYTTIQIKMQVFYGDCFAALRLSRSARKKSLRIALHSSCIRPMCTSGW